MIMTFKNKINELLIDLENKKPNNEKVLIGLDGFVDKIVHVVAKRKSATEFDRMKTIKEFGDRIVKAAGLSTNFEMVVLQEKLGGNGPILSNALLTSGLGLTYIGALGYPQVDNVFQHMQEKGAVYSIANPGTTDALEFDDGKLMIGKLDSLNDVNWENIKKIIGIPKLTELINDSSLFGLENWTMLPHMSSIWRGIIKEVLPNIDNSKGKRFMFFDLADPEKRTNEDIIEALQLIQKFNIYFNVILGLNFKEAVEIAEVLGLEGYKSDNDDKVKLKELTEQISKELNIHCLVIHPTIEATAVVGDNYYHVDGPYTANPILTTGAGDNFNAGFCLGQILKLSPEQSLILGVATSGYYVRNAKSPSFDDLKKFLNNWSNDNI
ncbi:PfkB family carbohydrate kinase [Clostridium sp.]|uniref:PfkB family carbohydrate kinase n=1 Tax=Clostridium sp. TaxID=1506 RepID=UPI003D6D5CAB